MYTTKHTFSDLNNKEGEKILSTMIGTPLSKVTLSNRESITHQLTEFLSAYADVETLSTSKRTKDVMTVYPAGGMSAVAHKIMSYVDENQDKHLNEFFYHIALFVSLQTLSGYRIAGSKTDDQDPIKWFYQNRLECQDTYISGEYQKALARGETFCMVLPEGDEVTENYRKTLESGATIYQVTGGYSGEKVVHTDEHAVQVIYTPNVTIEEMTHQEIGILMAGIYGTEAIELLESETKVISVIRVTHIKTGEFFVGIIGHPKSFGSMKDLVRNENQMRLLHMMKDVCFAQNWDTVMMGDFNTPIHAPPGTLKMTAEQLGQLPLAKQEGWFWALMRKMGVTTRTATVTAGLYDPPDSFNQEDIPEIERSGEVKGNSQIFKNKKGVRSYRRDGIFANFGCELQPMLDMYPLRKHTPIIPTVGDATAAEAEKRECWSSDHPSVNLLLTTPTWKLRIYVFNRLANSALGKDNIPEDIAGYDRDLPELLGKIWENVDITPE